MNSHSVTLELPIRAVIPLSLKSTSAEGEWVIWVLFNAQSAIASLGFPAPGLFIPPLALGKESPLQQGSDSSVTGPDLQQGKEIRQENLSKS